MLLSLSIHHVSLDPPHTRFSLCSYSFALLHFDRSVLSQDFFTHSEAPPRPSLHLQDSLQCAVRDGCTRGELWPNR